MPTRREALVSAGLAKPGRGKFSKYAIAWLESQRANGITFSDDDKPVTKSVATKPKTDTGITDYVSPSAFPYPEDIYKAVGEDGKTYSMRECCNTCRVSLVGHGCLSPTIHGGMPVKVTRR